MTIDQKAAKEYEKHVAENGKPQSHAKAKELLCVYVPKVLSRFPWSDILT